MQKLTIKIAMSQMPSTHGHDTRHRNTFEVRTSQNVLTLQVSCTLDHTKYKNSHIITPSYDNTQKHFTYLDLNDVNPTVWLLYSALVAVSRIA